MQEEEILQDNNNEKITEENGNYKEKPLTREGW